MLYQDDIVSCKMEHGEIIAKVCGRALPHATLGDMYIIEPKESIYEPKDSIYSAEFTIYEGSWGDKYGARIELWFKPDNGKEFKVNQKNYIVEGWMR